MIGYFDTSAVIPLVIAEPSTPRCRDIWHASDVRVSSLLIVAEAHAALAQAFRLHRLTEGTYRAAVELLRQVIEQLDLVTPTRPIVDHAAALAFDHALRGYDAVHVASALALDGPDLVAVSGDRVQLDAWAALGLATVGTAGEGVQSV